MNLKRIPSPSLFYLPASSSFVWVCVRRRPLHSEWQFCKPLSKQFWQLVLCVLCPCRHSFCGYNILPSPFLSINSFFLAFLSLTHTHTLTVSKHDHPPGYTFTTFWNVFLFLRSQPTTQQTTHPHTHTHTLTFHQHVCLVWAKIIFKIRSEKSANLFCLSVCFLLPTVSSFCRNVSRMPNSNLTLFPFHIQINSIIQVHEPKNFPCIRQKVFISKEIQKLIKI